jgi:hypothetical protein
MIHHMSYLIFLELTYLERSAQPFSHMQGNVISSALYPALHVGYSHMAKDKYNWESR